MLFASTKHIGAGGSQNQAISFAQEKMEELRNSVTFPPLPERAPVVLPRSGLRFHGLTLSEYSPWASLALILQK